MADPVMQKSAESLVSLLAALLHYRAYRTRPQANLITLRDESMPFVMKFGLDSTSLMNMPKQLGSEQFDLSCRLFGQSLKTREDLIAGTTDISNEVGKAFKKAMNGMLRAPSAITELKKDANALAQIVSAFNIQIAGQAGTIKTVKGNQTAMLEELTAIMHEFFPKQPSNLFLNGEQSTELSNADSKKHRRYLDLRKAIIAIAKDSQFQIVAASGNETMDAQEVLRKQADMNVVHSLIPAKFEGRVDATGGYYTTQGKKLSSTTIGKSGFFMNKSWSPETDDTYYCGYYTKTGMKGVYTEENQKASRAHKFSVVHFMMDNLESGRNRWRSNLGYSTKEQLMNTVIEVIYQTSARSGHRIGNTAGKDTYGTMVWTVGHIEVTPSKIVDGKVVPGFMEIKYKGKKNQDQHHIIRPDTQIMRVVYATLLQLRKGKKPSDPLWTFEGKQLTANDVNQQLKVIFNNDDVTLHKFRHARGTKIAMEILDNEYPFSTEPGHQPFTTSDVTRYFKDKMLRIGEALGHYNGGQVTWRTAVDAYLDPTVAKQFFDRAGFRPPPEVATALADADEE